MDNSQGHIEHKKGHQVVGACCQPIPLMCGAYEPGAMKQAVESHEDADMRALALLEMHYLIGDYRSACKDAESLADDAFDLPIRVAAEYLGALSNMASNHPAFARRSRDRAVVLCQRGALGSDDAAMRATCAIIGNALAMDLGDRHLSVEPLPEMMAELPEGLRLYASFLLAQERFEAGQFGHVLGITETALSYAEEIRPVPMAYLHTIAASAHMALRQPCEAKSEFEQAWALASPDCVIAPFVEHYVKLQGLLDACVKKAHPEAYRTISKAAQQFRSGWVCMMDATGESDCIASLTASEMTIAGLARRGWTNRETAIHMGLSENTVKHRMSSVYQKLHVRRRANLVQFKLT